MKKLDDITMRRFNAAIMSAPPKTRAILIRTMQRLLRVGMIERARKFVDDLER